MSLRLRTLRFAVASAAALLVSGAVGDAADPKADYAALKKLYDTQSLPNVERGSDAHLEWVQGKFRALHDRGLEFISTYPQNPLRWDVLVLLQYERDNDIVLRADGSKAVMPRPMESALWRQKYFTRLYELLEAPDASSAARQEALIQLIDYYSYAVRSGSVDDPKNGIVPSLLEWVQAFHALNPRSGRLATLYLRVARMLDALDPVRCRQFLSEKKALHTSEQHPDPTVRRYVENFQRLMRNEDQPATELWEHLRQFDPTFTDLSPYRDKVVLIAYLAVDWTSHTMVLEDLYRKYHDAGLEIIQIAYHNRNDGAPLVQRDEAAMKRHVAEKKWPWRVLWAVTQSPNEFYSYWGLNTVPAYLVVGRDGRLAREIPGELKWDIRLSRELFGSEPKR